MSVEDQECSTTKPAAREIGRTPEVQAAYDAARAKKRERYGDNAPCPLCLDKTNRTVISDTTTMVVTLNNFPYDTYDSRTVIHHYLITPKRHLQGFGQFNDQEMHDYWTAYRQFSEDGYNTMTRPTQDNHRSVPGHVHTHLLMLQA